jgi:hypothetical protein
MVDNIAIVNSTKHWYVKLKYRSHELEQAYKLWQGWSMAIASPIFEICQDN